jgi:hypothetical protein
MNVFSRAIKILSVLMIGTARSVLAQVNTGELRVVVTDAAGPAAHVAVTVSSEGTHYRNTVMTNSSGAIDCKELPFGMYSVQVDRPGFAPVSISADIHSAIPVKGSLQLGLTPITTVVKVTAPNTLIDPDNTVRTRIRDQLTPRFWIAAGAEYNSGLPFDYTGTEADAIAQYGRAVVGRLNFARGRVRPALLFDATAAAVLYQNKRLTMNLQADGTNLSNRLDVIDFGGLFSGNAIGPARSSTSA